MHYEPKVEEEKELYNLRTSPKTRYGARAKRLPPNFAERVLEYELDIDRDNFNLEQVN